MARSNKNRAKKAAKKKAIQFQIGWGGLTAVVISTICVLLWTFIMGFWVGHKLVGRSESPHKSLSVLNKIAENELAPRKTIPTHEIEPAFPPVTAGVNTPPLTPEAGQKVAEAEKQPLPTEVITHEQPSATPKPASPEVQKPVSPVAKPQPAVKQATEPVKPVPAVKTARPAAKPVKKQEPKQEKKVAKEKPKPAQTYFVLQIASYRDKARAEKEAQRWRKKGITAQVSRVKIKNKGVWYRVYLGRYKTVQEATAGVKRLARKEGIRSYVVPIKH